jgi:putative ABC transport system permease protein
VGEAMKELFPEVLNFARLRPTDAIVSYNDIQFHEDAMFYADSSFLSLFSFPLVSGDAKTALVEPNSVVIAESAAKKYFKEEDPIGKIIVLNETDSYVVKGVLKEVPDNSHLKFTFLFSIKGFLGSQQHQWESTQPSMYTYVQLSEGAEPAQLESKLQPFADKKFESILRDRGLSAKLSLQPLEKIYLYSDLEFEPSVNGDGKTLYFLLTLAFFILIVVWINYVSLSTVSAMKRNKEVGVRLVTGGTRKQLVHQFLSESILVNGIAVVISIALAFFGGPLLSRYIGIMLPSLLEEKPLFWLVFFAIFMTGALLSGSYPAFVISGFNPSEALKAGAKALSGKGAQLRKTLVVVQFVFSTVLITSTFIIFNQMKFVRNKDLGININQLVVIPFPPLQNIQVVSESLKEEIGKYSFVKSMTASTLIPGKGYNAENEIYKENQSNEKAGLTKVIGVDYNFFNTYEAEIIEGRDFSRDYSLDAQAIILNEKAAKLLNISNLQAGRPNVVIYGATWEVIGIVKNFHQQTVKASLDPIVFFMGPNPQYMSIRLTTNNLTHALEMIEKKWKSILPKAPFNYFFLDDYYNRQYQADQRFFDLFKLLAFLSIIISSLGLLGLTSFRVLQRTKEIGIRKTLGANVFSILYLLLKDLFTPVLISSLIACPFAYFLMETWLQDFATRVNIEIWWFATSGFVVLLIALLVVSYHTLKAAVLNPVNHLRSE